MKPKVLLISPLPPPECGMATFTRNMLNSGVGEKYDLIVLNTNKSYLIGRILPFNVLNSIRLFLKLIYLILTKNPPLVFVSTSSYCGFYEKSLLLFLCILFRRKTLLCMHGGAFLDFYAKSRLKKLIEKTLDSSTALIVFGEYWKREVRKLTRNKRIHVLQNCVDASEFKPASHSKKSRVRVLFVGPLEKDKGVYDLLNAIGALDKKPMGSSLEFVFVGRDIENIQKKSWAGNVVFLGELGREKVIEQYSMSDILVLPSYFEACSFVLLEAMASGLPVVSTRVSSIPDLVEDGVNGFLVEPGDCEGLARRILMLAENAELRQKIGENNVRKISEHHALESFSDNLGSLLGYLMN